MLKIYVGQIRVKPEIEISVSGQIRVESENRNRVPVTSNPTRFEHYEEMYCEKFVNFYIHTDRHTCLFHRSWGVLCTTSAWNVYISIVNNRLLVGYRLEWDNKRKLLSDTARHEPLFIKRRLSSASFILKLIWDGEQEYRYI